jgi:hypothetical protein
VLAGTASCFLIGAERDISGEAIWNARKSKADSLEPEGIKISRFITRKFDIDRNCA